VAAAAALARHRDRGLEPVETVEDLDVAGKLTDPHLLGDRLAPDPVRPAATVPALENLEQQRLHRRGDPEAPAQALRHLAVSARTLHPDLAARGEESSDRPRPPERWLARADVTDQVARRRQLVTPIDRLALAAGNRHLVADDRREAVRIGGAADEG